MNYSCLYGALRALHHTSATGFEGFTKVLLEEFAGDLGIAFLSRAGYQQGVDASSAGYGTTWAALECKHYEFGTCPTAQELVGGLGLAINGSDEQLDLWLLVTTGAVGANHANQLRQLGDRTGTAVAIIDWQEAGLPRLAILCAAVRERAFVELKARVKFDESRLAHDLDSIATHASFNEQRHQLREALSAAHVGYSRARDAANEWIDECFKSSRNAFARLKQHLCPQDRTFTACIDRAAPRLALTEWFTAWPRDYPLAFIVGAEGSGKSWAFANWWKSLPERPLTLLVTSNMTWTEGDPVTQLARALRLQVPAGDESHWRTRLQRWLRRPVSTRPLVLLVFDGLNERPSESWISRLSSFRDDLVRSHVAVVSSCWNGYWEERLEGRIRNKVPYRQIPVGPYDDNELGELLAAHGVDQKTLRAEVTRFLRNPRMFRAAIELLPRLLQTGDLTVWRLLVTEAQSRLSDRPDIALSVATFNGYIVRLAREMAQGHDQFSRTHLIEISRGDAAYFGIAFAREIEEIAAGRLFEPLDHDGELYRVRPECVPLALGMVLADDVRKACRDGREAVQQVVGVTLEQYGGLSETATIVHGAVACGCLWPKYPQVGIEVLLLAWLSVRNRSSEQLKDFQAYLVDQPAAYLNVAEQVWPDLNSFPDGRSWMAATLLQGMKHPELFAKISLRVNEWLKLWCRDWDPYGTADEDRLLKQRTATVGRLAKATPAERALLDLHLLETPTAERLLLSDLAFFLVSAGPRVPFATGFAAWALSRTLMDQRPDWEKASWCIRLNRFDAVEFGTALLAEIDRMRSAGGAVATHAAEMLARALGTRAACLGLSPAVSGKLVVKAMVRLSMDALDPECQQPPLDQPLHVLATLDPSTLRRRIEYTQAEYRYEEVECVLAAFAPDELGQFVRMVLETAPRRELVGLRQLALFAVRNAQLIDGERFRILEASRQQLLASPAPPAASEQDRWFSESQLLLASLPMLGAAEQFDLLTSRPLEAWMLTSLESVFADLSKEEWVARVERLRDETSTATLRSALWFLHRGRVELSSKARDALETLIAHDDLPVRSLALLLITNVRDSELLRRHAESSWNQADQPSEHLLDYAGSIALGSSAGARYSELRHRVHPEILGWLATCDGSLDAYNAFAGDLDLIWSSLAGTGIADRSRDEGLALVAHTRGHEPPTRDHLLQPSRVATFGRESIIGQGEFTQPDMKEQLERLMDPNAWEQEEQRSSERTAALIRRARERGAKLFEYRVRPQGLREACRQRPELVDKWIAALDIDEKELLWRAGDFYRAIAAAIAPDQPGLAAGVLRRIRRAGARVLRTTYDPLRIDALLYESFAVPPCAESEALLGEWLDAALTDDDLFQMALVAQEVGRADWLAESIENGIGASSLFEQARALTMLGFLDHGQPLDRLRTRLEDQVGYLERVATTASSRLTGNDRARHWFVQHLSRPDEVTSWAAMRLCLKCIDRRFHLWSLASVEAAENLTPQRRKVLAVLQDTVRNAIERNEDRGMPQLKECLFGTRIAKGELIPWY